MGWQRSLEMSQPISNKGNITDAKNQESRLESLEYIIEKAAAADSSLPKSSHQPGSDNQGFHAIRMQNWGDEIARAETAISWTPAYTRKLLDLFASCSPDFNNKDLPNDLQARRAERLVLALDRLVAALPEYKNNEPVQSSLNQLFKLAQSIPDFDPQQFAGALEKFSAALAAPP
jgi:hypothetical protein